MTSWSIGYTERERLCLEPLSPPADDCGTDWITARATVDVGGFHGDIHLMITLADIKRFRDQLQDLYKTLRGEAEFTTIEDQIRVKLTSDRLGHITATGHLMDDVGTGNKLTFTIGLDQSFLQKTLTEVDNSIRNCK